MRWIKLAFVAMLIAIFFWGRPFDSKAGNSEPIEKSESSKFQKHTKKYDGETPEFTETPDDEPEPLSIEHKTNGSKVDAGEPDSNEHREKVETIDGVIPSPWPVKPF